MKDNSSTNFVYIEKINTNKLRLIVNLTIF